MTDNVILFNGITKLNLPPDRVLEAAVGKLDHVVIMGFTHDGDEYFASSQADGGDVMWLMERCKKRLLEIPDK